MAKRTKRTFAKLGYSHMDVAEIVTLLNRLLADYTLYQQKLKGFHWNITGSDFFELHHIFSDMYKRAAEELDEIAARIRLLGQIPLSTYAEYIKISKITETEASKTSYEIAQIVVEDIQTLLILIDDIIEEAQEINDYGTEQMLKLFAYKFEEEHWKLSAYIRS